MSFVSESEFKGNPLIVLQKSDADPYPFQFGIRKAQLIMSHVDDIKAFINKHTENEVAV
jgi:hypothetical protein